MFRGQPRLDGLEEIRAAGPRQEMHALKASFG